ncbi:unnamed protein product [Rotaria sordida]|uniref:Uncharacterized protein n=2 Tax=Rotaria sordida TaxID=392033 RepID=A0A815B5W5_9BILA|nr:unnamed protein product [Rotaria sordida]CAF1117443.1 unnamed protein product [Rotaria sordida]CAF1134318.1 unnamed protein product [Rotaria sordida]CAF1190790.1 unnamed protein product [Rotaria sordida]CAF1265782.1 unnamed protein product [Rotaria sordida]
MQQPSNYAISITVVVILLALYLVRSTIVNKIDGDKTSISLCQVHFQLDESNGFDDEALLSALAILKMHDFQIGQPVWIPSNILLYLCEHRLKSGLKQSIIDQELKTVIKTSKNLAWSCA